MDLTLLSGAGEAAEEETLRAPVHEVVNLTSESESEADSEDEGHEVAETHHLSSKVAEAVEEAEDPHALGDGAGGIDGDDEEGDEEAWEEESLFEDAIQELGDEHLLNGEPDICTLEEAKMYREQLRRTGPEEFCRVNIESDAITAKKLLTAFGIRPPPFLEGMNDEAYYGILGLAISRELQKRIKLPEYNTVDDAVDLLKKSNNIIVLTGAGISTSLGIPDFRSKDTGLYSKLEHLGLSDPQEVFDIEIFREDPSIFYSIARDILPSTERFSPTHAFIRLLQDKGKLLTNYSQNIDNLESKAGILPEKLIQCHGSFATASCVKCGFKVPGEAIFDDTKAGRIPRCKRCIQTLRTNHAPAAMKRKRSANGPSASSSTAAYSNKSSRQASPFSSNSNSNNNTSDSSDDDDDYDSPHAAGVMKPDITFFGEALPSTFSDRLTKHDKDLVDLVIVIGTSLKVAPVSEVIPYLPANIPQMYISRTPVAHVNFDIDLLGDCDVVVAELCRRAGWGLRHEMVDERSRVGVRRAEGLESRWVFDVVKEGEGEGSGVQG